MLLVGLLSAGLETIVPVASAAWDPASAVMLAGPWVPKDPGQIDPALLPRVPSSHAMISDVRDRAGKWVHQHAYLTHHQGLYWAMWSDGPGLPIPGVSAEDHRNRVPGHDQAGTRISFATSPDGLHWSVPGDLSGAPLRAGYGWIARGFWIREGELLALGSSFQAPGYAGAGLSLEAFRWDAHRQQWLPHGTVMADSMNNFPPKNLPSGEWMMTRRDGQRQVSVMIGGVQAFDQWQVQPLASYDGQGRPEEPYWYLLPDGRNIVGLIRDNGRSGRLLRTFSSDQGRTWSPIVKTDFPDATSKFFVHRTSRGDYVLVSNSNPRRRDPLTLAISRDGLVFDRLFYLVGGRHIDYPHVMEHEGHLLIAFSGAKQTMEVLQVSLDDLEVLRMPESVVSRASAAQRRVKLETPSGQDWLDLGDEGKTLSGSTWMKVPEPGRSALLHLATRTGERRVTVGVDAQGHLLARLFHAEVTGLSKLTAGQRVSLSFHITSHVTDPDVLELKVFTEDGVRLDGVVLREGRSSANLSRVEEDVVPGEMGAFQEIRVGAGG